MSKDYLSSPPSASSLSKGEVEVAARPSTPLPTVFNFTVGFAPYTAEPATESEGESGSYPEEEEGGLSAGLKQSPTPRYRKLALTSELPVLQKGGGTAILPAGSAAKGFGLYITKPQTPTGGSGYAGIISPAATGVSIRDITSLPTPPANDAREIATPTCSSSTASISVRQAMKWPINLGDKIVFSKGMNLYIGDIIYIDGQSVSTLDIIKLSSLLSDREISLLPGQQILIDRSLTLRDDISISATLPQAAPAPLPVARDLAAELAAEAEEDDGKITLPSNYHTVAPGDIIWEPSAADIARNLAALRAREAQEVHLAASASAQVQYDDDELEEGYLSDDGSLSDDESSSSPRSLGVYDDSPIARNLRESIEPDFDGTPTANQQVEALYEEDNFSSGETSDEEDDDFDKGGYEPAEALVAASEAEFGYFPVDAKVHTEEDSYEREVAPDYFSALLASADSSVSRRHPFEPNEGAPDSPAHLLIGDNGELQVVRIVHHRTLHQERINGELQVSITTEDEMVLVGMESSVASS